jgi:predicted alpha/beta hydrolase family esterase
MDPVVLTVPGYTGSGPGHWQTLWERERPGYVRVEQDDWNRPDRRAWTERLGSYIRRQSAPVVLLAHSCGATTAALWASENGPGQVAGVFLVAPADADATDALKPVQALGPMPARRLQVPSVIVASDNDSHLSLERARELGALWGSRVEVMQGAGHINTASGHGKWPEGKQLFDDFLAERGAA